MNRKQLTIILVAVSLFISISVVHPDQVYGQVPGTEKWSYLTGFNIVSSPAIGSDGTIYVGSEHNNFYAINPDGTENQYRS